MVSFSCRISPRTSTVILRDKSPRAMAVATSAMLRTWPVRLLPIELTLSVRSFQTPLTSFTSAWPPSLPSQPTPRATRVNSAAPVYRDLARQVTTGDSRGDLCDVTHLVSQVARHRIDVLGEILLHTA